jgi:type II secretory pathway component PulM
MHKQTEAVVAVCSYGPIYMSKPRQFRQHKHQHPATQVIQSARIVEQNYQWQNCDFVHDLGLISYRSALRPASKQLRYACVLCATALVLLPSPFWQPPAEGMRDADEVLPTGRHARAMQQAATATECPASAKPRDIHTAAAARAARAGR